MLLDPSAIVDTLDPRFPDPGLKVEGQPVLIDFSTSLFRRADFESFVPAVNRRRGRVFGLFKGMVTRDPSYSRKRLEQVICRVREKSRPARVLIVGGGKVGRGCEPFYRNPEFETVSFDVYPSENTTFVGDGHAMPFRNEVFDLVVVQTVLEHVLDPARVVSEIYRVLKVGGVVYSETPFMQQVHEGAYDFTRFTESGHRWLFRDFHCLDSGALRGCGTQLMWSINYFIAGLFRSRMIGQASKVFYFWLQYLDGICGEKQTVDGCSESFFIGEKRGEPPAVDIIAYYQGAQRSSG